MSLFDYSGLIKVLENSPLSVWIPDIERLVEENIEASNNGHMEHWIAALHTLPAAGSGHTEIRSRLSFGPSSESEQVKKQLLKLHPWRKGPLSLGGVDVDTEWRSDWKWDRVADKITSLEGRTVLDIGCGNGYYLWRMLGAGAKLAIGVDPFLLFVMQYWATKHFAPPELPAWVLPMGWEDLPDELPFFDTVFSMGVLYHRRNARAFLDQLKKYTRPGGELVLETLVIDGSNEAVFVPEGRYAKMRNVWYIPTVPSLISELESVGWEDVRCIDVTFTSVGEQRSTEWMRFESLIDFLDPKDSTKTIEGYPAPCRAIFLGNNPN